MICTGVKTMEYSDQNDFRRYSCERKTGWMQAAEDICRHDVKRSSPFSSLLPLPHLTTVPLHLPAVAGAV